MPRKKSIEEKSLIHQQRTNLFNVIADLYRYTITPPGTTKSWLTASKRCSKLPHHYPQLTELTADSSSTKGSSPMLLSRYVWKTPFPGSRLLPGRRWTTHKSAIIDPYDARNQVMKFNYIIKLWTNKNLYAVSLQGAFVEMVKMDGRVTISRICKRRAVPSSANAKYFREYLIESNDELLLVYLIYRKSLRLVNEIEVLKLDLDSFELVKVDRLHGRTLFFENEYCLCVDSRKIGCRDDCVFFTGGLENDEWWMYDMESRSIFPDCSCSTKSTWGGPNIQE